jgi:hypothetical protein
MSDFVLIDLAEIIAEAKDTTSCPDCPAGLAVHVFTEDGEWAVIRTHAVPCPAAPVPPRPALRLVWSGDAA